ncbi:MAG: hypothetical protein KH828_01775 [Clostridiales bacterium]|nr:hypothetical protein [Clostridiales bacterium]
MAKELVFHKYHGMGNEYLVYDINKNDTDLDGSVIRKIHNRNFGVGLDGILVGPFMNNGSISMKIYNPDGGEIRERGKGANIFSKYLKDAGYVKSESYILQTSFGDVKIGGKGTAGEETEEICQSKIYCWC